MVQLEAFVIYNSPEPSLLVLFLHQHNKHEVRQHWLICPLDLLYSPGL